VTLRVIGPGVGRTGTSSLKLALERLLGGRCHHMAEVLADRERHLALWEPALRAEEVDWEEVFAGYVAQVDFPGAAFWPEIVDAFPDALVVLSTRPAESWYRSASSTIFRLADDHGSAPFREIWRNWLGDRFDDPAAMIAAYERHNTAVRSSVPPDRLLEWTVTDGWQPLCDRLGLPVPDAAFPWTNTTAEFLARNRLPTGDGNRRDEELQAVTVGPLQPHDAPITLAEYDPEWPRSFRREAARLRSVLGAEAVRIEHVGSTSVPGLAAKPIVDIVLVVPDSADEPSYVPRLQAAGYTLRIREPGWFEHRLFKGPDLPINLHVFSRGTAEIERMVRFRDRLRSDDRALHRYERVKRDLAQRSWRHVQDYADAKTGVVDEILADGDAGRGPTG
jgi:GrpB-like predicted nucleotidyltransferase (UPF0157 family)